MTYKLILKIFLCFGALTVAAGYYTHQKTLDFLDRAIEVDGVVTKMIVTTDNAHKPVVEYVDHKDIKRTHYSTLGTNPPSFFEGEKVTILYDPSDTKYPLTARVKSKMTVWALTVFLYIFGGFFIFVASLCWYILSKGGVIIFGPHSEEDRYRP